MPSTKFRKKCAKCGQVKPDFEFYKYKPIEGQPEKYCDLCRDCLTVNVNNFNPDTFLWILQDFDIPYVPRIWNATRDRAIEKAKGKPLTGYSVIGSYLRNMKLSTWIRKGFKDSESENDMTIENDCNNSGVDDTVSIENQIDENNIEGNEETKNKRFDPRSVGVYDPTPKEPDRNTTDLLKQKEEQYKNGEISKELYEEFVKAMSSTPNPNIIMSKNGKGYATKYTFDPGMLNNTNNPIADLMPEKTEEEKLEEIGLTKEDVEEDINTLTKEDKIYLKNKWGLDYTPNQWINLEQSYNNYIENCEEITQAIKEQVITICKLHLKATEALDSGDMEAFTKLNKAYLDLQKAGKFTEAQNKKDKDENEVTSISQIVEIVEKYGGVIPPYNLDIPQDIIDYEIRDINNYTKNLITNELGFGNMIEEQLNKMRRIQEDAIKQQQEEKKLNEEMEEEINKNFLVDAYEDQKQEDEELYNIEPYDPEVPEDEDTKRIKEELKEYDSLGEDRVDYIDPRQKDFLKYANGQIYQNINHECGNWTNNIGE